MMRVWRLSVCLSVAYSGPNSRTERPRKTKIGTEVAQVTRDSDTTFKVKRSKVNLHWRGILWRPSAQLVFWHSLYDGLVVLWRYLIVPVLFLLSGQKSTFCPLAEKLWIRSKKWITPFRMGTTSSVTMQSLGEIVQRAPVVGAKMWCLSLCFFCLSVTLRVPSAVRSRGAYFEQALRCRLYADLDAVFSTFSQVIALSEALHSSHICR